MSSFWKGLRHNLAWGFPLWCSIRVAWKTRDREARMRAAIQRHQERRRVARDEALTELARLGQEYDNA